MVNNKHQYIRLKKNDIVLFSSSPIPGNKIKIELLINQIYKSGAEVKENRIDGLLHISGHAYQEEQRKLISLTKPKYFVPVHGFYRQAAIHGKTAKDSGAKNVIIIKNGEVLSIKDGFVSKSNEVIEDNPIYIDSNIANFQTNDTILVRENLSQNGFVNVVALIDSEKKEIIGKTRIICRGSLYAANSLEEVDKIQRMAHGIILYSIKNSKSIDENA
ncbi:MAG: ribonuclease J, partial [Mycoplasma sp.]|nr:ribonuclease J [Mycoplasma sp.]